MINERQVLRSAGRDAIASFLQSHSVFELVRASGKARKRKPVASSMWCSQVIVFETNIPIQLAFYALLEHESSAAPLWDSLRREFVGLMTITDFVDILRHYHDQHGRTGAAIEVLASRSIAQVLADADAGKHFKHATEALHNLDRPQLAKGQISSYGGLIAVDTNGTNLSHDR